MAKKKESASPFVPAEEQPYRIPDNWCWVHLLDSFENHTDSKKKIQSKKYLKKGKLAIVDQGHALIGGYTDDEDMSYLGQLPVIIFGDHTRCVKYVDFPFAQGADGIKVLSPKQFYDIKAFYFALQSINIPNMGYRRHFPLFPQFSIPVPPLPEQQRIVSRIESLFAKLDETKAKAQAVVDGFELRKSAILHKAFTGELTERWRKEHGVGLESWDNTLLSRVVSGFKYGTSEKSNYTNDGMPVLRIPNIGDDGIDFTDIKYLSHMDVDEQSQIHENDILIIRSNGSRDLVGKCALVPHLETTYAYASFLIRIKPSERIKADFLVYYLNSSDARGQMFIKAKSSSGIHNINSKELGAITIRVPSLEEQIVVIKLVKILLSKEQQAKEAAEAALAHIDAMKKAILARAFRGELGTNDPAEERSAELVKSLLFN